jgi:hypothetical protein
MYTSKDRLMLERAYNKTRKPFSEMHLAGGMSGVPVMVTMDMPGASISHEDSSTEEHDESEIDMAVTDLHKLSEYAPKLEQLVKDMPSLEGWVAAKITKAADYISAVYHSLKADSDHDGCGCGDTDSDMFTTGHEDATCSYAARGCKCGGCEQCH